jgi:hypothetical protein
MKDWRSTQNCFAVRWWTAVAILRRATQVVLYQQTYNTHNNTYYNRNLKTDWY